MEITSTIPDFLTDPVQVALISWALFTALLFIFWLVQRRRTRRATAIAAEKEKEVERAHSEKDAEILSISQEKDAEIRRIQNKYAPIIDLEAEKERIEGERDKLQKEHDELRQSYRDKRNLLSKLEEQVAIYDERLALSELAVYEPHFAFGDSEDFKKKIKEVRDRQKDIVKSKSATMRPTDWEVDGSKKKGDVMVNRQNTLTVRAFNNECEAAISNTTWRNVKSMEKRIIQAAKSINGANASMGIYITDHYVQLKLKELYLTHEYREQQKIEKDERAERAKLEREERKLQKEREDAEKKERQYQDMLDQARREAGDNASDEMRERIRQLEEQLEAAHSEHERALAMAQMTKSGYIYIISNIGSFGEDIVKIGLTRRLDPDDRVRELGDASVPFKFDTHAIIYSDEAPSLENALHAEFADRRINAANMRKEFFKVSLDEVEDAVGRIAPGASFFKDREAQEWHETMARRNESLDSIKSASEGFPEQI